MLKHMINRAPPKMCAKAPAEINAKAPAIIPAKALFRANHESGGIFEYKIDQVILTLKISAMLKHLINRAPAKISAIAPAKTNAKAPAIIPAKKIKLKLINANSETGGICKHKIEQSFPKTSAMLKHLPNIKPAKTNAKAPAIIPAKKLN
jgi:hypothetical protein